MSFAYVNSTTDLYPTTGEVLRVTIASDPVFTATDTTAADYPGGTDDGGEKLRLPLLTKYAVYEVRVVGVVHGRPGLARPSSASTLRVGFNVLNPELDKEGVSNAAELRESGFPQVSDLPAKGSEVIVFVVPTVLGALGNGYEGIEYATRSGSSLTFRLGPGRLKGRQISEADLEKQDVNAEFAKPWTR